MGQRRTGAAEGKPRIAKEYRLLIATLMVFAMVGGAVGARTIFAPTISTAGAIDLTAVSSFALLANTYTNTGGGTVLDGDLGYTVPPANFPTVNGVIYSATSPVYIAAEATQAQLIATL